VLDNQWGDAKQVALYNGWLTYGEPLHRLREFGAVMKEMDIIDESTVSSEQMRVLCSYLFLSGDLKQLPHPDEDWSAFSSRIKELSASVPLVFDTISNSMKPWVDMKQLNKIYKSENANSSTACTIM
jgi:hypothetical protein